MQFLAVNGVNALKKKNQPYRLQISDKFTVKNYFKFLCGELS